MDFLKRKTLINIVLYLVFLSIFIIGSMFVLRGGIFPSIKVGYYALYAYVILITAIFFRIRSKTNPSHNKIKTLSLLIIPFLLLSCYLLVVNFRDLYPIIVPASTIIAVGSIISSYLFIYKSKRQAIVLFLTNIGLIFIWTHFFLTPIAYGTYDKTSIDNESNKLLYTQLEVLDERGFSTSISSLIKSRVSLLDFMFYDCLPCRNKIPFLNNLGNELKDSINIIIIVNGHIDSFEYFKLLCKNYKNMKNLKFYYDNKGKFTSILKIDTFPREYIIDKKGNIKLISRGFEPSIENSYIKKRKNFINEIN